MPGVTTAIAAGAGLLSAGSSAIGAIGSNRRARDYEQQIANFQRQDLENPYKNIRINTDAADQQTESLLSSGASSISALQRGGIRAVIGGIPQINESNILLQEMISRDITNQQRERDLMIARGEEQIQQLQERREEQALLGLGQAYQTARQDTQSNFNNFISSGLSFASAFGGFGDASGGQATTTAQVPNGARVPVGTFQVRNPLFTGTAINPITGQPY